MSNIKCKYIEDTVSIVEVLIVLLFDTFIDHTCCKKNIDYCLYASSTQNKKFLFNSVRESRKHNKNKYKIKNWFPGLTNECMR